MQDISRGLGFETWLQKSKVGMLTAWSPLFSTAFTHSLFQQSNLNFGSKWHKIIFGKRLWTCLLHICLCRRLCVCFTAAIGMSNPPPLWVDRRQTGAALD